MNRPRLLRALRITWTTLCGIAAVLLAVLWVRSYSVLDELRGPLNTHELGLISDSGLVYIRYVGSSLAVFGNDEWLHDTLTAGEQELPRIAAIPGFRWRFENEDQCFILPIWFLTCASAVLGTVPWIP